MRLKHGMFTFSQVLAGVDRVDEAQMRLKPVGRLSIKAARSLVDRVDEAQMRLKLTPGTTTGASYSG